MFEVRTDLAFESHNMILKNNRSEKTDGIASQTEKYDTHSITRVKVKTKSAAEKIKKPIGSYVTLHSEHISSGLFTEELSKALASELKAFLPHEQSYPLVLVAGLGNSAVTPDSIGPRVVSELIITRHIKKADEGFFSLRPVCALAPGVLGITGMESAEIFSAVCDKIKPDIIIAVDALAAADIENLGTTLQLSDTGISPGSGVHNRRNALNRETLNAPVIALGIPTVCDLAAVQPSAATAYGESIMVTPKSIDAIVSRASTIISRGLNLALQSDLSYSEITDFTS